MPRFRYKAMSSSGELVRGTAEGSSQDEVLAELRSSGLFVQSLKPLDDDSPAEDGEEAETGGDASVEADQTRRDSRPRQELFPVIGLSLFSLGGLFFLLLGSWNVWEMSRQMTSSRPTKGIVRSTEVGVNESTDSDGRSTTHHVAEIEYAYEVDGQSFSSTRVYPGAFFISGPGEESTGPAQQLAERYAPETEVTVWYRPDEPGTAFLERFRRVDNGVAALIGGVLAAAGIGLLLPMVVSRNRFLYAGIVFLLLQTFTWLICSAFLTVPEEELSSSPYLLQWLLVAYVVVCWCGLIFLAPEQLHILKEATLVSVLFGTVLMSLSLFVLIPLHMFFPEWKVLIAFPWVGVGSAAAVLVLWMFGRVTVGASAE